MRRCVLIASLAVVLVGFGPAVAVAASDMVWQVQVRDDLSHYFTDAGTDGAMVAYDPKTNAAVVVNPQRAGRGYLPASTFKIVNSLIGLETGAAKDVDAEVFVWDGSDFKVKDCNRDQTLTSAFRLSCVPVYQQLARRIGAERFASWLAVLNYGNRDVGGAEVDQFWLQGKLRITAWEQVAFLARLAAGKLPFSARTIALVHAMMVSEQTPTMILRAKTGLASAAAPPIGWWVGWIERDGQIRIFALNLDVRNPEHLQARIEIGKAILRELGAL